MEPQTTYQNMRPASGHTLPSFHDLIRGQRPAARTGDTDTRPYHVDNMRPDSPSHGYFDLPCRPSETPRPVRQEPFPEPKNFVLNDSSIAARARRSPPITMASLLNDEPSSSSPPQISGLSGFYTTSNFQQPISSGSYELRARHRLSEKHRRDGQSAFIRCSDLLRSDVQPFLCRLCPKAGLGEGHNGRQSPVPSNSPSATVAVRSRKAKNDQLAESFMWEFMVILHHCPTELPLRIRRIEELAQELEREKMYTRRMVAASTSGAAASVPPASCEDEDVRALVVAQVLQRMREECARHGIDARTGRKTAQHQARGEQGGGVDGDADSHRGSEGSDEMDTDTDDSSRFSKWSWDGQQRQHAADGMHSSRLTPPLTPPIMDDVAMAA